MVFEVPSGSSIISTESGIRTSTEDSELDVARERLEKRFREMPGFKSWLPLLGMVPCLLIQLALGIGSWTQLLSQRPMSTSTFF